MNIYAGRAFGWGWPEHEEHGFLGGDDMKSSPGEVILAPVAGRLTSTNHTVTITEADGWKTQCLELAETRAPATVKIGDRIGVSGRLWPHWHSIRPDGTRVPARFLQPLPIPSPQIKENHMRIIYNTDNSNDDTRRALVGEMVFQVITAGQSTRERKLWGDPVNFTQGEWDNCLLLVNARRTANGLPAGAGGGWVPTDPDIVDEAEMGQALTSTASLIINDLTPKIAAIGTKIDNLTLSNG